MIPIPDLRYEAARDHLLQAMAILPTEGSEVIRLLVDEASRRCKANAYGEADARPVLPPDHQRAPDTDRV